MSGAWGLRILLLLISDIAVNLSHDQFGNETITTPYRLRCFNKGNKHCLQSVALQDVLRFYVNMTLKYTRPSPLCFLKGQVVPPFHVDALR